MKKEVITAHVRTYALTLNGIIRILQFHIPRQRVTFQTAADRKARFIADRNSE